MTIRKCGYADERGELREELVHNKQDCPKSRAQQKKQKHMQNGATGDNFKCWLQLHRGSVVATTRWWVAGKAHAGFAEAHTPPPRTGALTGDNLIPCLPMRTTRAVPTKLKCRCSCSSLHTQPQEIFIQAYKTKTRDHRKIEPKTVSLCVIFGSFKDPFFFFVNRAPRTANWVFFA